jgi:hypothetical protein
MTLIGNASSRVPVGGETLRTVAMFLRSRRAVSGASAVESGGRIARRWKRWPVALLDALHASRRRQALTNIRDNIHLVATPEQVAHFLKVRCEDQDHADR